jgi:Flp pilus assembly protein TadD
MLFARRDYDAAREQFLRLTEVAPKQVEGWSGLVESLLRLGREHDADGVLDKGREAVGEQPQLLLLVARKMLRQGDVTGALDVLQPITRDGNTSNQAAAYAWAAIGHAAQGDVEAAHAAARSALDLEPRNAVARYALGIRTNLPQ